ncbi:MAG TPA: valine--tRNA ligase [Gemmatimonadaceae bacterium]|nr:valine--tRNA ligase [Gemmatimonadaceae bacterium]
MARATTEQPAEHAESAEVPRDTTGSSARDLPPHYDFGSRDPDLYARWESAGVFRASTERSTRAGGDRPPFVILMPPPNVTAVLHMGHGLNNTVPDVIVRWRRMAGDETLWVPGTDHAGIATQNVIERQLTAEGSTRFDLGRDAFVARTTEFVEETGGTILQQLRTIGASADWSRTAYTLSPQLSRAVREAFVRLYEKGLIYRGHRVIHWCTRCLTALSDEEAEHAEHEGRLYHIRYPLIDPVDGMDAITVATTRPETMLGDVAVAVHPNDPRYAAVVGRAVSLPVAGVTIPVISDAAVEQEFGTGAVKITPAHDSNDFELGLRHNLPMPIVITPEGRMDEVTDAVGRVPDVLRGLDRFEARERIVAHLEAAGLLEKVEAHRHSVRHCYRCDTVVEPRLSDQWFVRMRPLAAPALAAVTGGTIRILPERWEAVYVNWMENIRDWNISRQLWWGHRIPVWYCDDCDPPQNVIVSRDDLSLCPWCGAPVRQDEDVLDTWFSSWLWPLSTLGWPDEDSEDLRAFYPTDVLSSAPDILFFWIARMVMAGYEFRGEAPFHTIYLHGTVRDTQHRKMSKSLGNGIDPLDVVRLYGADALRWTMISGLGMGADVMLDPDDLERSFAPGRNFVTKLWNIGRYLLSNAGTASVEPLHAIEDRRLAPADRWILARLDAAIAACDDALGPARSPRWEPNGRDARWPSELRSAGMRLNEYAESARQFVWNELADWYLESVKHRLAAPGGDADTARAVLVHVFDAALRLLHPIVPFISETLWQQLPAHGAREAHLASARWPRPTERGSVIEFERVREIVTALRQIRADYNIPPGQSVRAWVVSRDPAIVVSEQLTVSHLVHAELVIGEAGEPTAAAHAVLGDGSELIVPLAGLVDIDRECARLRAELSELERHLGSLEQRLANERFTTRAPAAVVDAERQKQREWSARRKQLARKVEELCAG